jgi:hypothetical protein
MTRGATALTLQNMLLAPHFSAGSGPPPPRRWNSFHRRPKAEARNEFLAGVCVTPYRWLKPPANWGYHASCRVSSSYHVYERGGERGKYNAITRMASVAGDLLQNKDRWPLEGPFMPYNDERHGERSSVGPKGGPSGLEHLVFSSRECLLSIFSSVRRTKGGTSARPRYLLPIDSSATAMATSAPHAIGVRFFLPTSNNGQRDRVQCRESGISSILKAIKKN